MQNACWIMIMLCPLFTLSKSQMIWLRSLMLLSSLAPSTLLSSQSAYSVKEANITATVSYSSWYSSSWSLFVFKNQLAETKVGNFHPYLQNNISNILIYSRQTLNNVQVGMTVCYVNSILLIKHSSYMDQYKS